MLEEKKIRPKRFISAILALLAVTPAWAEESWTDLGIYLFATGIQGEVDVRNVSAEVEFRYGFHGLLRTPAGPVVVYR
jgi:hypothetical protein